MLQPRPDISDLPLSSPDQVWYIDGSCLRNANGILCGRYAVVSLNEGIESNCILWVRSAQAADLVSMIRSCVLWEGERVSLFTDFCYWWSVCFSSGQIWSHILRVRNKP